MTDARAAASAPMTMPRWLRGFAWTVAAAAFLLVLAGGQVTSTDSGDAVPTWPFPILLPMKGGVFFELGHRHVAGLVGALTLALGAAMVKERARLPRGAMRFGAGAVVLVVLQAGLGGVRVLAGARLGTSESPLITAIGAGHALLGQTFFCWLAALVYLLGPAPRLESGVAAAAPGPAAARLHRSALLAGGALYLQLLFGAVLRLTRPGPVAVLVLLHLGGAVLVILAVLEVAYWTLKHKEVLIDPFLKRLAAAQAVLLGLQLFLGFGAYFAVKGSAAPAAPEVTWKTILPTLHLGAGALLLMITVLLALASRRQVSTAGAPAPGLAAARGGLP